MTEIDAIFSSHHSYAAVWQFACLSYLNNIMLAISHFQDQIFLCLVFDIYFRKQS